MYGGGYLGDTAGNEPARFIYESNGGGIAA
jgi:hypothetical protein